MNLKKILVGHTGFVGSNLVYQTDFDAVFNSKNISDAFGTNPDLLVYSGVRAEKFLANKEPENDFQIILNAIENIKKINPKKIILISTVDVYPTPFKVDENENIDENACLPYGKNRLYLERWVEQNYSDYLILRLPALFGQNIKKNFIYDLIHIIPAMLSNDKFLELSKTNPWIAQYYTEQQSTFYKLNDISTAEKSVLKDQFLNINFSALNFTDSRSVFQFYDLKNLWSDIVIAQKNTIKKLNLATEPISASEIYNAIFNKEFVNEVMDVPANYNFYTTHSKSYNYPDKYIKSKEDILKDIKTFITEFTTK
jgi:hypothetical protein